MGKMKLGFNRRLTASILKTLLNSVCRGILYFSFRDVLVIPKYLDQAVTKIHIFFSNTLILTRCTFIIEK